MCVSRGGGGGGAGCLSFFEAAPHHMHAWLAWLWPSRAAVGPGAVF